MIGRALDAMPADALERIVSRPVEAWTVNAYVNPRNCACLMGAAVGAKWHVIDGFTSEAEEDVEHVRVVIAVSIGNHSALGIESRFDFLADRFSLSRIVPLIQARARKALARKAEIV